MLGIDIVYLPEFKTKMKNIPLTNIFLPIELSENKGEESLAGIFAAKEAFFKAVGRKEDWLSVWIEKTKEGKPQLKTLLINNGQSLDVSISHAGDYVIAIVMING